MLRIIGIISSLVLPSYAVVSNQSSVEIPMHCINTVPCKPIQRNDWRLQNQQLDILLPDLLTTPQARINQTLKTVVDTGQKKVAQPLSHVATSVLKSKHMAMLFPVR